MNLKAMRENDVVNKLLNEIKNNHPFPDQDSLNIVCKGKIHSLPLEWGLFNDFKYIRYTKDIGLTKNEITKIFKNPKLIHQTRPKF
jgi:lipopolysaccharide biosynthesis glycosyltransferase